MIILFVFVIGLCFGSFINALVYRLKYKQSIIKGRSKCPNCQKELGLLELVPIISFVIQKGRCTGCKENISWQYPLVELLSGLLFVIIYLVILPETLEEWIITVGYAFFSIFLIAIFTYDFKYYLIPDVIVIPGIVLAIIFSLISYNITIWKSFLGAAIAGGFFLFLVLVSKEKWMGWGDVKLGLFIGALLGWPLILLGLLMSFVLGAAVGIGLIIFKKKNMKSALPFGTFLTLSAVLVLLWGNRVLDWYLEIIGY